MNGAAGPAALTARGRAALVCGLAAMVYARLFGTADVALLGAALVAAALIARVWVGRAGGPHVAVRTLPAFAHAGERVRVEVELRPLEGAHPGRAAFIETDVGQACALRPVTTGGLRVLRGSYELGPLTRGLRELGAGLLVREDPFGLARRADATRGSTALTVLAPPLVLEDGALGGSGEVAFTRNRLRSGGHELHGVREHQPGESLRGVHWPATAHHGRLMVKELDDPAGDDVAIVLDARASADVGNAPDSSFELAVAAAGALAARAFAGSRRVRLVVAGGDGEPATATERTAVRRLLARARPAGERPPGDLLGRLAAERIEVVTSRPAALVGAGRPRQLGVVAIDPSSFDPAVPRDAEALAALEAAGTRVVELRRQEREPEATTADRSIRELGLRSALYAIVAAFGLLHARDLQIPALSTARLAAIAALATPRPSWQRCRERRPHVWGLAPNVRSLPQQLPHMWGQTPNVRPSIAGLVCGRWCLRCWPPRGSRRARGRRGARRSAGSRVSSAMPRGAGSRSCCRSRAGSSRSCGRSCSSSCSRGSPRSRGCGSRARARSRPGSSHCCRSPSARPSTSCRSIHCAHLSPAGCCSRSCSRAAPQGAAPDSPWRSRRWRSRSAPAGPPCPRRRIRPCCPGRRGRSRTPTTGPPSIWCGT